MSELFELLEKLTSSHGPSGDEGEIRNCISQLVSPYADEVNTDVMGNLIVRKKGSGAKVMFSAHMDSIGFIVTHITKEGFLRCGKLGGVRPQDALYTTVRFKNGVHGVFVKQEDAKYATLKLDQCFIDIGAQNRAEAEQMVSIGDTAVYDIPLIINGCNVISPYMDNRISCAILIQALERLSGGNNELYFVFSAQEEVGLRGAKTAAYAIEPDYAVAVDVTDVDDVPGGEQAGTSKLGQGAAIKVMDRSVICHPKLVTLLETLAKEASIRVQRDIIGAGGTDAGVIHTSRAGVITGGISMPCRYIHTPGEMVNLDDAEQCVQLITALAQTELAMPENESDKIK